MDTSGRAILLAGATVVIALLGMFATGVAFMYGLAIAAVIAVLLTLVASLTLLPALLSRFGPRLVRPPAAHAPVRSPVDGAGRGNGSTSRHAGQGGASRRGAASSAGAGGARSCRPGRGRWRSSRWR